MTENTNEQLFIQHLEQAKQNASPEKTYGEISQTIAQKNFSRHEISKPHVFSDDSLLVDNPEDFRLVLEIIQRTYPWVTDEYIQDTVEHETEHIEAGKDRFKTQGEKVKFFYGVRFLNMENGNLGVYPFYIGFFDSDIKEGPNDKDREFITKAAHKKSPGDKRRLGEQEMDITKGYE